MPPTRVPLLAAIRASGAFAVSVLARGQEGVAARLADPGRSGGAGQFSGVAHRPGPAGPVLTEAAAWLECRLWAEHAGGDYRIVCGEVAAAGIGLGHPLVRIAGEWMAARDRPGRGLAPVG